ncbi:GTP-binding protein [Hydrogenivirga caldilitoris]|uniref:Probable GTP-binding protein EngB n=1 Tax=Hydrogenivirga caldilitoris TaxID=246264 RepID=A0A497XMQ8_9AQUI|nr:ribosome biogenesis GTP-binding protein YihA/YsxC [Hydrogenivirga caldilitoris]RLJ70185.1 GTP-binding protein [Hydrogenivirga caldilitoris]
MKVQFLKSTVREFPPADKPEVVFVGRSNVGKSSLINMVTGRNIARVSKEPGRTRTINYFLLEDSVYLVDVPGYGFARVPKEEQERWKSMMENYFRERKENIKMVFVLIDAVAGVQKLDEQMLEWLQFIGVPFTVVLTKTDKAKQKELSRTLKQVKGYVGETAIVMSSAKEGKGKKEILSRIFS